MQYFFIRFIYDIIQWESICSHIFPADIWIYYSVPFGIAEFSKGNGRMTCSPVCGASNAYNDSIFDIPTSETVQVFLKGSIKRLIQLFFQECFCIYAVLKNNQPYVPKA